ncbi:hypothetical protein ENUP19_0378G0040 [Entamoeba nuttalli]|uniref:Rab GTPase activating protein, putative n=2 Tax=Entamoeba nuttalli TaxID=412467 RepID=K2G735_ENTNP|nr:Rab GTPase activating protein, putative [Entamoeba nuttalli P19]EKE38181.1 Rab GTPase activating protein, putative [Entamoeba nuttalli P19]|eukprot:XP_008859491.1 Rab GTPase activating protein, putative [Entamoeba nuttalli P19]
MNERIESLFIEPVIDITQLRKMMYSGKLQVNSALRPKAWQILLGYLPPNQFEWGLEVQQKSQQYKVNTQQLLPSIIGRTDFLEKEVQPIRPRPTRLSNNPKIIIFDRNDPSPLSHDDKTPNSSLDTPRNENVFAIPERSHSTVSRLPSPKSFFDKIVRPRSSSTSSDQRKRIDQDAVKLKYQIRIIDNDIPRTLTILKIENENNIVNHRNVIKRILYCLVAIDKIKYTQGMNELVSVLYYVFALHSNNQDFEGAEVSSYYCMKGLLKEYSHYFNEEEDDKDEGINKAMDSVMNRLKEEDNELFESLQEKGIENALFLFRWMSLLLTEELPINSLVMFWDRILANLRSRQYLQCFCVSMIISIKDELMEKEFDEALRLLQHYPLKNFNDLDLNAKLMIKFPKKSKIIRPTYIDQPIQPQFKFINKDDDKEDGASCIFEVPHRSVSSLI